MNRFSKMPPSRRRAALDWKGSVSNCVAAMVNTITTASDPVPVPVTVIRSKMLVATRSALGEAPSGSMLKKVHDAVRSVPDPASELVEFGEEALPGMLRMMLLDKFPEWQDASRAETVMAFVQERTEAEILDYWHGKVRATVGAMYDLNFRPNPLSGATVLRSRVERDVDAALDPTIGADDTRLQLAREGEPFYTGAGMLRLIVGAVGLSYADPTTAATVRRLADETLAERVAAATADAAANRTNPKTGKPWTWEGRLAMTTRMFISADRSDGKLGPDAIRQKMLGDFERAFEPVQPDDMREMDIPRRRGRPGKDRELMISSPTAIRMTLWCEDVDWYEPSNRARAEEVVRAAIEAELATS